MKHNIFGGVRNSASFHSSKLFRFALQSQENVRPEYKATS